MGNKFIKVFLENFLEASREELLREIPSGIVGGTPGRFSEGSIEEFLKKFRDEFLEESRNEFPKKPL